MTKNEIRTTNINIIQDLLEADPEFECDIVGSLTATVAQFIAKFRKRIINMPGDPEVISLNELLKMQISELTQCIIDLQNVMKSREVGLQ